MMLTPVRAPALHAMTDSEFLDAADATLERIGRALDAALQASDVDMDWSLNDGRPEDGLHVAFSPDGIRWTKHPGPPLHRSLSRRTRLQPAPCRRVVAVPQRLVPRIRTRARRTVILIRQRAAGGDP